MFFHTNNFQSFDSSIPWVVSLNRAHPFTGQIGAWFQLNCSIFELWRFGDEIRCVDVRFYSLNLNNDEIQETWNLKNIYPIKDVRFFRWNPLRNQTSVVIPLQHKTFIVHSKFIIAIKNQWSFEVFVKNINWWYTKMCDADSKSIHWKEKKFITCLIEKLIINAEFFLFLLGFFFLFCQIWTQNLNYDFTYQFLRFSQIKTKNENTKSFHCIFYISCQFFLLVFPSVPGR